MPPKPKLRLTEHNIKLYTRFKRIKQKGEDITQTIEQALHDAFWDWLHNLVEDNDELENDVLETLRDWDMIPKKITDFSQLGTIQIVLSDPVVTVEHTD